MKKWFLLLWIFVAGSVLEAGEVKGIWPMVDQRVELLSIVVRLAEYPEYALPGNKVYEQEIKSHFDSYKKHPLIDYVRGIREKTGIEYGAMMQMAVSLSQPPGLKPVVSLKSLEPFRWDRETSGKFLVLLWDFYSKAKCDDFFEKQSVRYGEISKKWNSLFSAFDMDWYQNFYGLKYPVSFRVFLNPGNSLQSYNLKQPRPGGVDRMFLIAAMKNFDEKGRYLPPDAGVYSSDLKNVIYLYNYPCLRPWVVKHEKLLKKVGESFVQASNNPVFNGSWEDFWVDTLSRAVAIHYVKAHEIGKADVQAEYLKEIAGDFPWMSELAVFLDFYENDRPNYPTFEDFLPRVNSFLKDWMQKNSSRFIM